ncbi:hypothetical protein [Xanthobacter sp. VNH20]|uniref:hypothetical protein n=1 Tax=Xanthobacter sp. VNH20 TaxID=3156616 RepID=UPI0032B5F16A
MGRLHVWAGGFGWGVLLGLVGSAAVGLLVFRADLAGAPPQVAAPVPTAAADPSALFLTTATTTAQPLELRFDPPRAVPPEQDLVIRGSNPTGRTLQLVLWIEDGQSVDGLSRFDDERDLAPGPFEWRVPLGALETPGGRRLDPAALTRLLLFTPEGEPAATLASLTIAPPAPAPPAEPPPPPLLAGVPDGQSWLTGARTTAVQEFATPVAFGAGQEVVVQGDNTTGKPLTVNLRIDDISSTDWHSRGSAVQTVPPGPFVLRSPVSSWVTPSKRRLDRTQIKRLIVFVNPPQPGIALGDVHVENANPLPEGALGLRFAPTPDIAVPGFETVLPNDPRLSPGAGALVRTQNDPLLSSGLNGIRTITVPWTSSTTATVSLWTEDQGEWEYFPHSLNRTITIDGQVVLDQHYTPQEWIDRVYHRGLWKEAMIDGDPWSVYARDRGGLVTATVPVVDGKIVVELASDQPPNNGYIAAMVVAPGASTAAVDAVEAWRRQRYGERWPVLDKPVDPALATGVTLRVLPAGTPRSQHPFWRADLPVETRVRAARGSLVSVDFLALSNVDDLSANVSVSAPNGVTPQVRWGKWTYMRRGVGENALAITSDVLEGDLSFLRIASGIPRRLNVTFTVPTNAPAGALPVTLTLDIAGTQVSATAVVDVLPLALPQITEPIGYYLNAPPYEAWFRPTPDQADREMACDYAALRSFGVTGISPDLVTPTPAQMPRYLQQTRLARDAGFRPPFLDYTSVKRLEAAAGTGPMAADVAAAEAQLAAAGLPTPLWAITDEPADEPAGIAALQRAHDALKAQAPQAQLAGQLNNPSNRKLLGLFDTVLVNFGYGVSAAGFAELQGRGITPWLYNMLDYRAAAGFQFWRIGARGYLQWHARAFTADPRDPTDGRESEYAILPLSASRCQPVPTVDARLIETADGMGDLQWLHWLEAQAAGDPAAKALRDELFAAIPADWRDYAKTPLELFALRKRIMDFAAARVEK